MKNFDPSQPSPAMPEDSDYDSAWKDLLAAYIPQFVEFFFLHIYKNIDWQKSYLLLDKELQKIAKRATTKRRYVDKLIKVWLKSGKPLWILLHIEIQGQYEVDFAQRIYIYNYRIYDLYGQPVVSLVLLADDSATWRPSKYEQEIFGLKTIQEFAIVKLLDYQACEDELAASNNPFAVAIMAHLKNRALKDQHQRYQIKKALILMLYERGYKTADIVSLFKFIDWIMDLPLALQEQLELEVYEYERSHNMPSISPFERRAIEKGRLVGIQEGKLEGIQEGKLEGEKTLVIRLLNKRFGQIPNELHNQVKSLSLEQLELLSETLLDFQSLPDVRKWLEEFNH